VIRRATPWLAVTILASSGCAEDLPSRLSRPGIPIKSACPARAASPGTVGFDVRAGRKHSEAQTLFVTNFTDAPHELKIEQVSRVEGPCAGDWARQTQLDYVDAKTCELPTVNTIGAKELMRIEIGAQRVRADWACTKMGIAVSMKVDDAEICADAGSWIATRDDALE
jgi:hypothetical protein